MSDGSCGNAGWSLRKGPYSLPWQRCSPGRTSASHLKLYLTLFSLLMLRYDDDRVMKFVLMRLHFPEAYSKASGLTDINGCKTTPLTPPPVFAHVTEFKTTGVVMNVFLLDPPGRLLSAFVWVSTSNTIGLYALLDWSKRDYEFIDTGIECVSNCTFILIFRSLNIALFSFCRQIGLAFSMKQTSSFTPKKARPHFNISILYPFCRNIVGPCHLRPLYPPSQLACLLQ